MPKIKPDLYKQAKLDYEKRFNKKWKVIKDRVEKEKLGDEAMVILQEYREVQKSMKLLSARRKKLKQTIDKMGMTGVLRSNYYKKPILLYVLELEDGFWYVGMSRDVEKRFKIHQKGKGARWTKSHRPLKIYQTIETGSTDDRDVSYMEDDLTLEFATNYGADKVRGGGYCQTKPRWPSEVFEQTRPF